MCCIKCQLLAALDWVVSHPTLAVALTAVALAVVAVPMVVIR